MERPTSSSLAKGSSFRSRGASREKPREAPQLHYKGFPKKCKSFGSRFSCFRFREIAGCLPVPYEKMADCETTTGHVGHIARTLMKDARRGLNR